MWRLCSRSPYGHARLDAVVDQASGTCVGTNEGEEAPISHNPFPTTEDGREGVNLVWCSPCGHMYLRPLCRTPIRELIPYGTSEAAYEADRPAREAERACVRNAARQQARANMPLVHRAEQEQVGRFKHIIEMAHAVTTRCNLAAAWCTSGCH